ncbi:cytochrome P450 [Streptomyces sp. NPDC102467]|uniref:cytochrome P450 n=1 Tax=Streptomyces sp. NPDC102467 TaxID=3366179 RepID=UPI003819F449
MLCPSGPAIRPSAPGPHARRAPAPPPSLADPDVARDPYPLYRTLRDAHPLFEDEPFGAWLLSRYVDVRAALTDPRMVAPPSGRDSAHLEEATRTAHHALASPALQGRALAALKAGADRTAHVLARRLSSRREADLVEEFCHWLPAAAVVAALGLPHEDTARVTDWCRTGPARRGAVPAGLGVFLRPHVVRRRAEPRNDLLSVLCAARADGRPLSDDAVTGVVANLLDAGGEATDRALASLLANLLDHPAQLALLRSRPDLAGAAWAESLRHDPAVHIVLRRALAPVAVSGGTIPAGATVACLVGSAGRDADRFTDPDRYDMFRAAPGRQAFGAALSEGLCTQLARLTAESGLYALLDALPGVSWAPGFRPVPEGLLTRSPAALHVRLS